MDRRSLFRRSGPFGRLQGLRVGRRKTPAPANAPGLFNPSPQNLESVNTVSTTPSSGTFNLTRSSTLSRIIVFLLTSLVGMSTYAATSLMSYVGCTPEPGSDIDNFEFLLTFDLTDVIISNGEAEYGIRVIGSETYCSSLYEEIGEEQILIGTDLTSNINGQSERFVVGNTLKISFPGLVVKPGAKYTLIIGNSFTACIKGETKAIKNTTCNYQEDKLVYKFLGKEADEKDLSLLDCSISEGKELDELKSIIYRFNSPISIVNGKNATLTLNNEVVGSSKSIAVNDETNELTVDFANIPLYNQNTYTVTLPEGIVCMKDNASTYNRAFSFNVVGTGFHTFGITSSTPENNSVALVSSVQMDFNLPSEYKLLTSMGSSSNFSATLYKESVSEENIIKANVNGEIISDGKGLSWNFDFSPEPSSKYIVYVPKSQFGAWKDRKINDYANEQVYLSFSTPSLAEAGIKPIQFQNPVSGQHDKGGISLTSGEIVTALDYIEIPIEGLRYEYDGKYLGLSNSDLIASGNDYMLIYDITNGSENLVKSCPMSVVTRETVMYLYNVLNVQVFSSFFEGHKYRFVIPSGHVTVTEDLIKNYARNVEWSFEIEGGVPTEVNVTKCTLENDAELSELSTIIWDFNCELAQDPDKSVQFITKTYFPMTGTYGSSLLSALTLTKTTQGKTRLVAAVYDNDGGPVELSTEKQYQIKVPEGLLYNPGDPSIKNSELVYNIKPVAKTPEVIKPEFVNVDLVTNEFMTTTQKAVKGEKFSYKMQFSSSDDNGPAYWAVKSAKQGNKVLSVDNGSFTTGALTADTTIDLEVEYTGQWAVDEKDTGVWEVKGTDISIFKDVDFIVVTGVTPENTINVYNVAGMLINTTHVNGDNDTVRITVTPGQYYIVTVDGVAAKIKM